MLLKDYQALVENGSYLSEENNKFVLHEVNNNKTNEYLSEFNVCRISRNKYIPYKHELFRVNSYNPLEEKVENEVNINGVYVYVPPKKTINLITEDGSVIDKYPTVIRDENILIFCSFDDLHGILNKVLKCKEVQNDYSLFLNCNGTVIKKEFWNLNDEESVSFELVLFNKCNDPDLMKEISPWIFVTDFLEEYRLDNRDDLLNDDDYNFWGVLEYKKKYYVPFFIFEKCYATKEIECYPTDIKEEDLPANIKRIMLPEENDNAIGVAYKRSGDNYFVRIWIKVEEYIRKFYKKSGYVSENYEIEQCVGRHLSILAEEDRPLYYQLEKEVPSILFLYDRNRGIAECEELLIDLVQGELNRHLFGIL